MSSSNIVILTGNVGSDPVSISTSSGRPMARFSVATHKTWKSKDGKVQEKTAWHRIVVFGKEAESCLAHLTKGRTVQVVGELAYSKYTNKQGVEVTEASIEAEKVHFIGRKSTESQPVSKVPFAEPTQDTQTSTLLGHNTTGIEYDLEQDDLPF